MGYMTRKVRKEIENARQFGVKVELQTLFSHIPDCPECNDYFEKVMSFYDDTSKCFKKGTISIPGEEFVNELFMFAQVRGLHLVVQKSRDMLRIQPDFQVAQVLSRQAVQSPRAYQL
jgi:lipid II:glycine glycyltransferase (peptidoglycan interpeptide bridge formation enzyme)